MVNKKPRNRIKKSLNRIRSSISNSLKNSNYFQKSKRKASESDSPNPELEVLGNLVDDDGFYDTCDNNVQEPNLSSESTSPNLQYSHTLNHPKDNLDTEELNQNENFKKLKSLEKEELDRICKEYSERNGAEFLEVGLRTYIDAVIDTKNFRNRCFQVLSRRPYLSSKYTTDHYHLRNYQNYLINNLRNNHFSERNVSNQYNENSENNDSSQYNQYNEYNENTTLSNNNMNNNSKTKTRTKRTLDLTNYRTTSESAHLTPNRPVSTPQSTNKHTSCTRCSLTPSNSKLTPMRGNLRQNKNKLTPQKTSPPNFNNYQNRDFNQHSLLRNNGGRNLKTKERLGRKDEGNNNNNNHHHHHMFEQQHREEPLSNTSKELVDHTSYNDQLDQHVHVEDQDQDQDEEMDLTDFISRYDYLNSDQRDNTPNLNLNSNTDTDTKQNKDTRKSNKHSQSNTSKELVDVDDEHVALEDPDQDEDVLSYNEKLKLLEKIGIEDDYIAKRVCSKFSGRIKSGKTGKKSLEDFNLFHKENLKHQLDVNYQLSKEIIQLSNVNTPDRSCSSEGRSRRRSYSLFDRISSTIDRNKDTSPTDILSLTIS